MDGANWTRDEYVDCLRQLRLINLLTTGYRPTLKALAHFAERCPAGETLRVLDVGFGYGDTLREISRWASRRGIDIELTGIDLQELSAEAARAATPPDLRIKYLTGDVFTHKPARKYHVIINALFMHHMSDEQAVRVLAWMQQNSTLGFFINDLHRHQLAYTFIQHFTRLFGFNRMICNDAPLSVARSFRAHEWREYAQNTGLDQTRLSVNWYWAFRYGVRYDH